MLVTCNMAKHSGTDVDAPPPHGSDLPLAHPRASNTNFCEIHYCLRMLDTDLTDAEMDIVRAAAADWCANNDCRTEAYATESGFVVQVWHNEPSPALIRGHLHDALRDNAFSKIHKGFVAV